MRRRNFLRSGAVVGAACVAGCMGDSGEENQEVDKQEAYRFYFDDRADTLGGAAAQQIPEDAIDQQVVTNDRSEGEWQEMQLNDVNYAELMFDQKIPRLDVTEGSVEDIEQKTIQLYQQRHDSNEFQNQHNAEIFTESVLDAVLETTNASTGAAQSTLVKTVADHIAHTNEQVDLQNYKLSEGISVIGDAGRDRISHPIGLLQYEADGETQVRYAEIENRMTRNVVEPEESVYASELGTEDFQAGGYVDTEPSDWVSVFDYQKFREMEENGAVNRRYSLGRQLSLTLIDMVDDAGTGGYDTSEIEVETGVDTEFTEGLIDSVISESFGKSLENYVKNPGEEYTREDLETTARAFFTATEAENFGSHFIMKGDLTNPEIYKEESETLEEIRADMAYDEVGSRVVS